MSLEQIISEHTLATRDLTAAVSNLAEVMKLVGMTGVSSPAKLESTLTGPATAAIALPEIPAAQQPVFNAAEVAADPLAQPAPAQASPAPSASTAAATPTAAPATTQSPPAQSGREYSQAEFLAVMKAYGNGQTAKGIAVERAPAGFLQGVLAKYVTTPKEAGKPNFRDVPATLFAEILAGVPAAVVQAALEV